MLDNVWIRLKAMIVIPPIANHNNMTCAQRAVVIFPENSFIPIRIMAIAATKMRIGRIIPKSIKKAIIRDGFSPPSGSVGVNAAWIEAFVTMDRVSQSNPPIPTRMKRIPKRILGHFLDGFLGKGGTIVSTGFMDAFLKMGWIGMM